MFTLVKLKNENMKTKISYLIILLFSISSCTTSYYTNNYYDPNYLNSDEFIVTTPVKEKNNDIDVIEEDYEELEILEEILLHMMKEQL